MKALLFAFLLVSPLLAVNLAKLVSASGTVYWYNPEGPNSRPCKQWKVRLIHLDSNGRHLDSLDTRTDSYGQYAFYGLPSGEYELFIPRGFGRSFRRTTRVPAVLEPVVLPPRLPAIQDSSVYPIQVESGFEKDSLSEKQFHFHLWVKVPPEWKPFVKKVRYFMDHPSFTPRYMMGEDPANNFMASYKGWGCLEKVTAEVFLPDGIWKVDFPFCASLKGGKEAKKKE